MQAFALVEWKSVSSRRQGRVMVARRFTTAVTFPAVSACVANFRLLVEDAANLNRKKAVERPPPQCSPWDRLKLLLLRMLLAN